MEDKDLTYSSEDINGAVVATATHTVIINNDIHNVQRLCDYHYNELVEAGIVTQHSVILEEFGRFPCDKCVEEIK
jgi:hypothetical protein